MKSLCKVWIDMEQGDGVKGCRKGIMSVNMEHEQIAAYVAEVLASGFPYQRMTINIQDLGKLRDKPTPQVVEGGTSFADMGDD